MQNPTHLTDLIEQSFIKEKSEYVSSTPTKKFYISDMGKCMRTRWLKRKGVEGGPLEPHVYWILKIGDMYHDFVYGLWEQAGLLVMSETYVENEHFVGRFDGITYKEDGVGLQAADIKSAKPYTIEKSDNAENVAQLLTYVHFIRNGWFREMPEEEMLKKLKKISQAQLIFINKEPGDRSPYIAKPKTFSYTDLRREKIEQEMEELVGYWEKDEIPPCTCPAWQKRSGSKYNQFYHFCSANPTQVKDWAKRLEDGRLVTTKEGLTAISSTGEETKLV